MFKETLEGSTPGVDEFIATEELSWLDRRLTLRLFENASKVTLYRDTTGWQKMSTNAGLTLLFIRAKGKTVGFGVGGLRQGLPEKTIGSYWQTPNSRYVSVETRSDSDEQLLVNRIEVRKEKSGCIATYSLGLGMYQDNQKVAMATYDSKGGKPVFKVLELTSGVSSIEVPDGHLLLNTNVQINFGEVRNKKGVPRPLRLGSFDIVARLDDDLKKRREKSVVYDLQTRKVSFNFEGSKICLPVSINPIEVSNLVIENFL